MTQVCGALLWLTVSLVNSNIGTLADGVGKGNARVGVAALVENFRLQAVAE
jgi:hypothetical protein